MKKNNRVKELESELNKIKQKEIDKLDIGVWLFFLLTLPLLIIGYLIASVYLAVYKTFNILRLSQEEKKKYYIGNKFNPCEYLWSRVNQWNNQLNHLN